MKHLKWGLLVAILTAANTNATDRDDTRDLIECMAAKPIVKFLSKFTDMKPEHRDSVDAVITAGYDVSGGALPDRLFYRLGDKETQLPIKPDGHVPAFASLGGMDKKGELCSEDKARMGTQQGEDSLEFDVEMDIRFNNQSGVHSLAELQDGAVDGKKFYKKIVPGPVKLLIPKMTHVTASLDLPKSDNDEQPDLPLTFTAMKGEQPLEGLIIERFEKAYVVSLEQLETLGADGLKISGAPYLLEPSPSIEKMKKLGFGEDEDKESEE